MAMAGMILYLAMFAPGWRCYSDCPMIGVRFDDAAQS